jgi:peptidoglycan/LPS O-acetylase OafA/YrhL
MSYLTGPTLQERLVSANSRPTGFDYMRIILSTLVLVSHTINVCYGKEFTLRVWEGPARPFLAIILPIFFALSGFLVAGSLERCKTLVSFAGLRVIRLIPALAVETLLSAIILGTIFTEFSLGAYFSAPEFYKYFLNIIGKIHYTLPGVFLSNPWPAIVNSQLWTLPFELYCYAAISALVFLGIAQKRKIFVLFLFGLNILIFMFAMRNGLKPAVTVSGPILVQCFLFGIAGYLYRDKIVWNGWLGLSSGVITLCLLATPSGDFIAPLFAAYLTVYLGLLQPHRIAILFGGDYSYGIFLYGYPIQQAVVATLGPQEWYTNLAVSLPLTVILAIFSWRLVEKPALKLRLPLLEIEAKSQQRSTWIPGWKRLIAPIGISKLA